MRQVDPEKRAAFLAGAEWFRSLVLSQDFTVDVAYSTTPNDQMLALALSKGASSVLNIIREIDVGKKFDICAALAIAEDASNED